MNGEAPAANDLEARLGYLEEVNRWTLETLNMVTSLSDFQNRLSQKEGPPRILAETRLRLRRLMDFEATAFLTINETDQSFDLADCEPDASARDFEGEVQRLIEEGTFAWSLYQFRAVMVPGQHFANRLLLHVVSTKSRTRAMFIGVLAEDGRNIYDTTLNLLSIVLLNCANALERYDLFKKVHEQNLTLEDTVRKRTEEMEVARRQAEEANKAKSEFLSNMSHELRSPLNAIIGFSDVLLLNSQDDEVQSLVPKIKDAGRYLTRLIEDLLDLDRIEAGMVRLDLHDTPLNHIIASTVEFQLGQLPRGFSLECTLDPDCGEITCDATRIRQVLVNLLDNAIKYSPGGGTIRIRTRVRSGEVWVSVEDEGIGILPEERSLIFERFRQLESGYTRRAGGLGIGLSLVKKLVTLHGGRIWVDSDKGKGSAFTFALPRPQASKEAAGGPSSSAPPAPGEAEEPWTGLSVLIADDLEDYHKLIRLLMRHARVLHSAYNGAEAIEMARRERPDVILMDLRMPVLDGFEAIRRLKADPEIRDIPVLGVSAQAMKEDRERCLQSGAEGYITKPIDLETFRTEFRRVLA